MLGDNAENMSKGPRLTLRIRAGALKFPGPDNSTKPRDRSTFIISQNGRRSKVHVSTRTDLPLVAICRVYLTCAARS
jgi:hypothetical protein